MWNFIKMWFKYCIIGGIIGTVAAIIFDVSKNYKTMHFSFNYSFSEILAAIILFGLIALGLWLIKKFFEMLSLHCQALGFWGVVGAIATGVYLSKFIPGDKNDR